MGCISSSEKPGANQYTASFDYQVKVAKHPVAIALNEEWSRFVDAYRSTGNQLSAAEREKAVRYVEEQANDMWANTSTNLVSHLSVDEVGKKFLFFVRNQITELGWGGNFDYKVVGTVNQGFIIANAELDVSTVDSAVPLIKRWTRKIHYHSLSQASKP